ncbi:MAG: diphosphate--fructose-6-phosphate 1-phosphotransferase [Moraxellaceae bacterium]|jgi:6-phosphofructokinase 1|nr:diphosphate--fructose-6-phosphate 1-phosphotransferase [Moraxellaceae bacterium]
MRKPGLFYAQSGGVTAVINASAAGVLAAARMHRDRIGHVYAGENGILGALGEELFDLAREGASAVEALRRAPGSAFGSSRYPLGTPASHPQNYTRLLEVFRAHDIRWFLYNGGGGSAGTCLHVAAAAKAAGYELGVIHIPKTVDNDLARTDFAPGFGSVAKYTAVSVREAALDVASMARTSTQVFVMEVMGRHAGWIAAASALAQDADGRGAPHLILFPEVRFDEKDFLARVQATIAREGFCVVVAAEGLAMLNPELRRQGEAGEHGKDRLNVHTGKAAPYLAALIQDRLGVRCHFSVSDYLQRSARHIAARVDVDAAFRVGAAAVEMALAGRHLVMPGLVRRSGARSVRWDIAPQPLARVANKEELLPRDFISRDGYGITPRCRAYLLPLIQGEDYPPFRDGLPWYVALKREKAEKRLPPWVA